MLTNNRRLVAGVLSLLIGSLCAAAGTVETPVVIRVQSNDAKFIGSQVGEMNVIVEDASSGALLASGRIGGGTGDTERLIKQPLSRGMRLSDDKTAAFVANLRLDRPTRVRIRVTGPLAQAESAQELAVTTWVVPGRPIGGDGIVLKLPGLIVTPVTQPAKGERLTLTADVTLMCGCPITRDGLWDAADYEVRALVTPAGGKPVENPGKSVEVALEFTGQTNRFSGTAPLAAAGPYDVTLWAHNAKTGNTGVAHFSVP
jgi:hypothetical protein